MHSVLGTPAYSMCTVYCAGMRCVFTEDVCKRHTSWPLIRVKTDRCMHVAVSLQSTSCIPHRGHFSVVLQQDGVIRHVGVAMPRRGHVLLHVDAVLVKLHGCV